MKKISEEVFFADGPIVRIGIEDVVFIKQQAINNVRKRARICAHHSNEDQVHEMLIAISAGSYIHPHKHLRKIESFHIIEGLVNVVIFDDAGKIADVLELGDTSAGKKFYYRLSEKMFHTLIIKSEVLVFHEVTNGPFVPEESVLAPFAPKESSKDEVRAYMAKVGEDVNKWIQTMKEN